MGRAGPEKESETGADIRNRRKWVQKDNDRTRRQAREGSLKGVKGVTEREKEEGARQKAWHVQEDNPLTTKLRGSERAVAFVLFICGIPAVAAFCSALACCCFLCPFSSETPSNSFQRDEVALLSHAMHNRNESTHCFIFAVGEDSATSL